MRSKNISKKLVLELRNITCSFLKIRIIFIYVIYTGYEIIERTIDKKRQFLFPANLEVNT